MGWLEGVDEVFEKDILEVVVVWICLLVWEWYWVVTLRFLERDRERGVSLGVWRGRRRVRLTR